jgi:Ca-activated chloride channel family protein
MGLATAVNRLKDSKAKSKVIILLTDGVNNAGFIEPETAADIAKQYGIKVYTIGIGTNGMAEILLLLQMVSFIPMMKVEIDDKLMKSIVKRRAVFSEQQVIVSCEIYGEINKLETTEIELKFYDYDEI